MAQIKCPKCGNLIPDNSKFCLECGTQITKRDMDDYNNSDETVDEILADINGLLAKPSSDTSCDNDADSITHKKREFRSGPRVCFFIVVLCIVGAFVIAYFTFAYNSPVEKAAVQAANNTSNNDYSEITKTRNSLSPYLDVLGMQDDDGNIAVSAEFISGLSSVYIMGRTGTVTHSFLSTEDPITINLLEWQDNSNSSDAEFKEFIEKLNTYFDSDTLHVTSYIHISDEAYIWFDSNYGCCAILWRDGTTIHIRWDKTETSLNDISEDSTKRQSKSTETTFPDTYKSTNLPATNTARHTDIEAWSCAQNIVKGYLKSPSTAKFCSFVDAEVTHLGNGEYMVTGWVDSQNSFSAMIRSNFVVTYTATPEGYKNGIAIFN